MRLHAARPFVAPHIALNVRTCLRQLVRHALAGARLVFAPRKTDVETKHCFSRQLCDRIGL
jgi:hypothetical protein